ncbi:MAG: ATP synthase F1 subunit delta, partial [Flavobacteriales bacterium]|nr:ATP synthase F1 subunit delta [Flavobacteriales bacterium]
SREDKIAALSSAVEGKKAIADLVSLVINKGRAEYLMDILAQIQVLNDQLKNVCHVSVASAVALSPSQEKEVEQKMKSLTGASTVILHTEVDPALLGGMKITVADRVWDGTVAGRLDEIKKKFQ